MKNELYFTVAGDIKSPQNRWPRLTWYQTVIPPVLPFFFLFVSKSFSCIRAALTGWIYAKFAIAAFYGNLSGKSYCC